MTKQLGRWFWLFTVTLSFLPLSAAAFVETRVVTLAAEDAQLLLDAWEGVESHHGRLRDFSTEGLALKCWSDADGSPVCKVWLRQLPQHRGFPDNVSRLESYGSYLDVYDRRDVISLFESLNIEASFHPRVGHLKKVVGDAFSLRCRDGSTSTIGTSSACHFWFDMP